MMSSQITRLENLPGVSGVSAAAKSPALPERQEAVSSGNGSPQESTVAAEPELVLEAVAVVEGYLQDQSRNLQFQIDDQSGKSIVSVLDGETGEIIRQFPSEAVVASARYIAENIPDQLTGLLLDKQG